MREILYHTAGLPCTLALLTDFHNGDPEPVAASLAQRRPDLICIAGDIIYNKKPENGLSVLQAQKNVPLLLKKCVSIAPTFLSLGNHESRLPQEDISKIRAMGVCVLDNAWASTRIKGKQIVIGGLTSQYVREYCVLRKQYPEFDDLDRKKRHEIRTRWNDICTPDTSWLLPLPEADYIILLSHHPEYFQRLPKGIHLVLSGHAHGGQWRLFGRGLYAPNQGWLPRYTKGIYEKRMIVSAGLTNTAHVPRLFNPTELIYVTNT